MVRKKTIIDPTPVTVTLSAKYLEYLKKITIRVSQQQGKPITLSQVLRAVIEQAYPMPKNLDLFEDQTRIKNDQPKRKPNQF